MKYKWMSAMLCLLEHELEIKTLDEEELSEVISTVLNKRLKFAATSYFDRKYRRGLI